MSAKTFLGVDIVFPLPLPKLSGDSQFDMDARLIEAKQRLGKKYLCHPDNQVKRRPREETTPILHRRLEE